jgi:hypothetical protein
VVIEDGWLGGFVVKNFEAFGKEVLDWMRDPSFFSFEESEELCEMAERHGLVERVVYDEALHGEIQDCEPGDRIWWFTR